MKRSPGDGSIRSFQGLGSREMILAAILLAGMMAVQARDTGTGAAPPPTSSDQQAEALQAKAILPTPITDPAKLRDRFRQVVARPEFQESTEPDATSRLQEWIAQWFTHLAEKFQDFKYASTIPAFASMMMTVLSILSVAGLLYIIMRLTRRSGWMELEPPPGGPGPKTFRPPESYDVEIQGAIKAGDWHGAWLASWRQFLSRLENRRLVESDRTRTNREYLAQLRGQPLPASALALVTGMVDAYDRFIYGRQSIGEPDWNLFHRQINEAGLLLHLDDRHPSAAFKQERA